MSGLRNIDIWKSVQMGEVETLTAPPLIIEDTNLSRAWGRLLLQILDNAGTEVSPLILSLTGFAPDGNIDENTKVRRALNQLLKRKNRIEIDKVAFTIFPQRIWLMSGGNRNRLFETYRKNFPRWQAMNRQANGRGMYFERMTMYRCDQPKSNQLDWILTQYNSRKGSAVQCFKLPYLIQSATISPPLNSAFPAFSR